MIKTDKKFTGLDHLRALAISLVFLFHYSFYQHPAWMERFSGFGWCGVDLFFVLSGFLISNQLFAEWQNKHQVSLPVFYLKRAFRILPPYFFVLLIYIFVPAFHEREKLAPLWKMFTYLFFLTPQLIYDLLPPSILVAVLAAFGVMSKQNEITAFKACGVSLYRLAAPILIGSILLSGGLFAFDFYYVAGANRKQDKLRDEIKGRATQGVTLFRMEDGERVVSVERIADSSGGDEE